MRRTLIFLALVLLATTAWAAQTATIELGTGYYNALWEDLEDQHATDRPDGGPGVSIGVWKQVHPVIVVGLVGYTATLDLFPFSAEDYAPSLKDPKTSGAAAMIRFSRVEWYADGLHTFLQAGLSYRQTRWIEVENANGFPAPGDPPSISHRQKVHQGGVAIGVGVIIGTWMGRHWVIDLEYDRTVIHRERRGDYVRMGLAIGF